MSDIRDALKFAQERLALGDLATVKGVIDALVAAAEPPYDYVLAHEIQCEGLKKLNAAVDRISKIT